MNTYPPTDLELLQITGSLRGRAKSSRPRRQAKNARRSKINQKPLNMQNKPNLLDSQMNESLAITKDYGKNDAFAVRQNKPNQTQFQTRPLCCSAHGLRPFDYAQDNGVVPRMCFAIFGGRWRISVKWEIKTFSTSLSVPTSASASNFTSLRQFTASFVRPIVQLVLQIQQKSALPSPWRGHSKARQFTLSAVKAEAISTTQ